MNYSSGFFLALPFTQNRNFSTFIRILGYTTKQLDLYEVFSFLYIIMTILIIPLQQKLTFMKSCITSRTAVFHSTGSLLFILYISSSYSLLKNQHCNIDF